MDPLIIATKVGKANVERPDMTAEVVILEVLVPVSRLADLDQNDTYRRELAQIVSTEASKE